MPLEDDSSALRSAELSERLVAGNDWSSRDAVGLRLTECRLDNVALDETALRRASIRDVSVAGGSWANVDASEAFLKRVEFRNTRLTGISIPSPAASTSAD